MKYCNYLNNGASSCFGVKGTETCQRTVLLQGRRNVWSKGEQQIKEVLWHDRKYKSKRKPWRKKTWQQRRNSMRIRLIAKEDNGVHIPKGLSTVFKHYGRKNIQLTVQSAKPVDKPDNEIVTVFKETYSTKPVVIAGRFWFHKRNQEEESEWICFTVCGCTETINWTFWIWTFTQRHHTWPAGVWSMQWGYSETVTDWSWGHWDLYINGGGCQRS